MRFIPTFTVLLAGAVTYRAIVANGETYSSGTGYGYGLDVVRPANDYEGTAQLSRSQALSLARSVDDAALGGWASQNLGLSRVVAIWRVESALKPSAINRNDPMGGAWGIGQVLAGVASKDYGVSAPDLLRPEIGARVSLQHMKSTYQRLASGLGREPTFTEWAQAYNVGVAGYLSGRRNTTYAALVAARVFV